MGIKIKLSLLFIFTLIINACLPRPEAELQRTQTSITLKGKIENSRGLPASRTAIYIEQSNSPEVLSAEDGSFYISLDAHKIAELRLQYGIKNKNIRLYFVQSDGLTESTMIPCINFFDLGVQDLGLVQLSVDRTVKGRVLAMSTPEGMLKPVKDARVKIGREEVLSNENGEFSTKIASNVSLPILIERTAYVQSQANWTYNSEDPCRDFILFSDLVPNGSLNILDKSLNIKNELVNLSYSATSFSHWIRISNSKESLLDNKPSSIAPWRSLNEGLVLQFNKTITPVLYYQFSDEHQDQVSPIQTINL